MKELSLTLKAVFATKNIAFTLLNIFIFVSVQLIFFYTIGSSSQKDEAMKKSMLFRDFLKNSDYAKKTFCEQQMSQETQAKDREMKKLAETIRSERNAANIGTMKDIFLIPMSVMGGIIALFLFRNAKNLNKMDAVYFLAIFLAFSTEMFYYFVVFRNIEFVGNLEVLSESKKANSTRDLPSVKPVYERYILHKGGQREFYYHCDTRPCVTTTLDPVFPCGNGEMVKSKVCEDEFTSCSLVELRSVYKGCGN